VSSNLPYLRIGILGVLTIVAYGSWFYGFGVLLDDMAADFDSGVGILTMGYTISQILTGVLGIWVGRTLDHHGARRPFAIGAAVGPGVVVASTYLESPALFAVVFGIGGGVLGASSFYHLTQTVAARLSAGSEARAIAQLTIWGAFSSPILIPVTELMRSWIGWRDTVRVSVVVVGVVLVVAAVFVDRDGVTRSTSPSASSRLAVIGAWKEPLVRRYAFSSLASSFGTSIIMVLQIPAMVAGGLERSTAASMAGARGFAQLFGRLPLGRVLDTWPTRNVLISAKLLIVAGGVLLAFSGNVVVAVLFVIVGGVGIGAVSPLDGIYAREVLPTHDLGTLMGSMHFVGGFMAGIGPLVGALVIDLTDRTWSGLVLASATVLIGAASLVMSPRRARPR
jgi:MFS family permease